MSDAPTNDSSPQALPALPDAINECIDRWFLEAFHNSPLARATELFNHVSEAVLELKIRLKEIIHAQ